MVAGIQLWKLQISVPSTFFGEVPKWLKGIAWKAVRSLIAARGFKSLLLRFMIETTNGGLFFMRLGWRKVSLAIFYKNAMI